MFKVDLHTHSTASPDGGINTAGYKRVLEEGKLDYLAVTDHNRIDFALELQAELGEKIIVGEEIMAREGEIIGLYLTDLIPPALPVAETIKNIRAQGGLVYVPHPFETVRKGLHPAVMDGLAEHIDIVEVCNGRALLQNRSAQAVLWARLNRICGAASSDAHGSRGIGRTYTRLSQPPNRDNLIEQLRSAIPITDRPTLSSMLYPKYHVLRKKMKKA